MKRWLTMALFAVASLGLLPTKSDGSEIDAAQFDSLQAAADAIPESGGILRIPPGEYELTRPLVIKTGNTQIRGGGPATHLVNKNTDGLPALLIENPRFSGKATPDAERLWRVQISDLRISGNEKSGAGIQANYVEEVYIHSVTCTRNGGDGIRLYYCYEDPRISNNLLTYNKACGIYLEGCHDIIVSANQLEENQDALQCLDSFNLAMSGNNLDDHLGDGVVIENTYGSVVASNMIEECQGWAVVLDRDCYGITVSANVIAHEFTGGVDLRDAHGCSLTGNTFTIVKKTGIAVREQSAGITISGNNFSDSWIGEDAEGKPVQKRSNEPAGGEENPNEAAGILLENCKSVVIVGNLFSRLATEPIVERGQCRRILLQANALHSDE
ncbi:MAG: right-handed parallel beta-helix repeat-containing protein [bacterium]|nr:right-handed parallel beta-helix repeat-containing protein [bacterium]